MNERQIDAELVSQAKEGDKHAFDLLMLKYQNRITKIISRYIEEPAEIMDVAQETFIKAYNALDQFKGKSSFYTWLFRIAVNSAKNHAFLHTHASSHKNVDIEVAEQLRDQNNLKDSGSPEGLLEKDEVEKTVFNAMENLPEDLKNTLLLRELAGLSYADIAIVMHCPIGTVRSRISRAREIIDASLEINPKQRKIKKN